MKFLDFLKKIFHRKTSEEDVMSSSFKVEIKDDTNTNQGTILPLNDEVKNYIHDQVKILVSVDEIKPIIFEEFSSEKATLFTIFGIFATLVTFVLTEVSILKNANNFFELSGLSLIFGGSLLGFVIVADFLGRRWAMKKQDDSSKISSLVIIPIVLVIIGLGVGTLGYLQNNKRGMMSKDTDLQQIDSSLQELKLENAKINSRIDNFQNQKPPQVIIYGK